MHKNIFTRKIAEWYDEHKRNLPWRDTKDPYLIWLSEVILQQTRVAQGLPYYQRFVDHYPNVRSLARAREQDVLRLWQGLGYYSRARNLHRCAKAVVQLGKFPDTFLELQKLPGIGTYTAAAIASLAFHEAVAVVDGNVYRVLSRVFGDHHDISTTKGKDHFFRLAQSLIPANHPDVFNQAIMEFGALQCVPRNPVCHECILRKHCAAFANNLQAALPVKAKSVGLKERFFYYFVIECDKKLGMKVRHGKDIWQGLYDFYLVESPRRKKPEHVWREIKGLNTFGEKTELGGISPPYTQLLSHQKLLAHFVTVKIPASMATHAGIRAQKLRFYRSTELDSLPKPVLITRWLRDSGHL